MKQTSESSGKWSHNNNNEIKFLFVIDSDGDDDVEMMAQILSAYTTKFQKR